MAEREIRALNAEEAERFFNEMQDIQAGRQAELRLPDLKDDLQNFAEGATVGSGKLLAIHYKRELAQLDINIHQFTRERNKTDQAKERKRKIEEEEIPLQEVMVPGFSDAYAELTPKTDELRIAYTKIERAREVTSGKTHPETPRLRATRQLLDDLNNYRQAGIDKPVQTRPSQTPQQK